MISEELQKDLIQGIESLTAAYEELKLAAVELAQATHTYRLAKARAYLGAVEDGSKRTVDHVKALVDIACEGEMLACRMAEAMHEAALERVRSLRSELSAFQSIAGAYREEAAAIRYGQAIA